MLGISFSCISFVYSLLLIIIFFSKNRYKSSENKVYSWLIVINFVGLIIAILCYYFMKNMDTYEYLNFLFSRLYLVYLCVWISIFTLYIYMISAKSFEKQKFIYVLFSMCLLSIILSFALKMEYSNNNYIYSYGPACDFCYLYSFIMLIISIVLMLKNYKKEEKIKYIPLIIYIVVGSLVSIIQKLNPALLLVTSTETFITFLMYFTIENPDMKMIKKLEEANIKAEKANRAKSDFLSSMSHEIRTPLNAIIGFSEAIKNDNTVEECHNDASDIIMAGQNLLEIINGILDISKIEANKMEIVNINYNLKQNCENIAKLIRPRIGDKPIELNVNIAPDIPDVLYGDGSKIKEVITNILTNAVKYTEKGFIDFKVSCINQKDTSTIFISVEDSGRGIKKENLEKLFTQFQRLDEDRNTSIEGTGLGLAITKSLVDMMGGRIIVQSKYGVGSKFSVYLKQKIVAMVDTSITNEYKKEDLKFENKKLLIVDDNNLNLKVAARLLKEFNLEPELLSSGFECIDKINAGNKYDLILLDDMMPKMTGVETLKKLKNIDGFNTPVVILTANAISGMKEKYLEEGFEDYLAKPIDKNELRRVLSNYLNKDFNVKKESLFKDLPNDIYNMNKTPSEISTNIDEEKMNSNENNTNILKENGIDIDNSIKLLGDIEIYNETLSTFLEENKKRLPEMKKYLDEKKLNEYSVIAHAIKSDSKYLGFTKLADLAFNHEIKGKENDYAYIINNLKDFLDELNRITMVINNYFKNKYK